MGKGASNLAVRVVTGQGITNTGGLVSSCDSERFIILYRSRMKKARSSHHRSSCNLPGKIRSRSVNFQKEKKKPLESNSLLLIRIQGGTSLAFGGEKKGSQKGGGKFSGTCSPCHLNFR